MRHERQVRLAGFGPAGQELVRAAVVEVAPVGFAGEVAARYLVGAGVARVGVRSTVLAREAQAIDPAVEVYVHDAKAREPSSAASQSEWRDPAARELAEGSELALAALRRIVQGSS